MKYPVYQCINKTKNMKVKSVLYGVTAIGFAGMLIFSSCKKKEDKTEQPATPEVSTPSTESGADNRDAQSENDAALSDINDVVGNSRMAGKGTDVSGTQGVTGDICGLSIDSVNISAGSITFNYTGVSCNNRTRTGAIKVSLYSGTKWKNAGTILKIDYINYKVTRTSDKKSITFNGTQYLTNISGGTWWDLFILKTTTSLVSTVTEGVTGNGGNPILLTFNDGKTATYNINRKITYTYPNNIITVTAEGIGSSNGLNNLENYGTARNGDAFTSQVTVPIVWNITCGGAVLKGEVSLKNTTNSAELKFNYGVDVNGNNVTVGQNDCPYGWKLTWTANSQSFSKVFGYN